MSDDISNFEGLSKKQPFLALMMAIFMFALAGLPPAMGGFVAKFYLFAAVIKGGNLGIGIIAVLSAVVACYYYLRIIVTMYFVPSDSEKIVQDNVSTSAKILIALCAALAIVLGVFPGIVMDFISSNMF